MWVTLVVTTVVTEFEVPGSLLQEGLVYEPGLQQSFQHSVDSDLVGRVRAQAGGDLVLGERATSGQQGAQDGNSLFCSAKSSRYQEAVDVLFGVGLHSVCSVWSCTCG